MSSILVGLAGMFVVAAALASAGSARAQTYGFATLQPGTLNHTTASAVAKVLKEKAGLNVLVQPTAGDQVIVSGVQKVFAAGMPVQAQAANAVAAAIREQEPKTP